MNEININGQIESQIATQSLMQDLRQIIEQARGHVAVTANYELTMMYWHIGERINRDVLGNQRAEYGKQIVAQVATQLQDEYGRKGFAAPHFAPLGQRTVFRVYKALCLGTIY